MSETPMMKQFLEIKEKYPDYIILFRSGDFYETFYEDAKIASEVLNITLTKRADVPMAGVPFHSVNPYIKKLLDNNFNVAICEQLEDPKKAKGLVKRGVTRLITPGTILEDEFLTNFENNFLVSVYLINSISEKFGVSIIDITTGEFLTSQLNDIESVKSLIKKYSPKELILNEKHNSTFSKDFFRYIENLGIPFKKLSEIRFNEFYAKELLKENKISNVDEIINSKIYALKSTSALLYYITKLLNLKLEHVKELNFINLNQHMFLDYISIRNLELIESLYSRDKKKSLFGILNNCKTSGGSRLLKKHLLNPLLDRDEIEKRLDAIEELNNKIFERDELRNLITNFLDVERIATRINSGFATPRDLEALKLSLKRLPFLKNILRDFETDLLKKISNLNELKEVSEKIEKTIVENAPSHIREIGYIKPESNEELKELFDLSKNSKIFIKNLEEKERLKTGINSLKIRFNKVFGYYIDVPKNYKERVPQNYILKQSLVNSLRYITEEIKEKEDLILNSEERIKNLEKNIFDNLIDYLKNYINEFQDIAKKISLLDVLITHSINSQFFNYVRPTFSKTETIIKEGRNPIVEKFTINYIPNDTTFNEYEKIKIITGPNSSGKSTYLRQNALIILMAQIGSFVPAKSAKLKIYDRIFTRIGAFDELAEGKSTFMIEMTEVAEILKNSTKNSFIILDEIGRGTSTYDGLAIAWAIIEELYNRGPDVIFATHYHQLNKLTEFYHTIKNYNVLVKEEGENIEFIRKIVKGGTDKSYGIYVGKLAGLPNSVLERAKEIQQNFEKKEEIKIKKELKPQKKEINFKKDLSKFGFN